MKKANIAVLVSGGGTNLQALLDAQAAGHIPSGQIVLVLSSSPKAYALERAKKAGVPGFAVEKEEFGRNLNAFLEEYHIDLVVLAGFLSILSADFTCKWAGRIVNIHPSLIPSFCGAGMYGLKVHEAALQKGVKVTGATVHLVNEIPDGGEILLQKAVAVLPGDTPEILQKRVMEQAEWVLLPQAVEQLAEKITKETDK